MNSVNNIQKAETIDHSAMRLEVIFRIARKNLFSRKLRTFLTILGVVIGVGAVVFLVSFGVGLQKLVEKQVVGSSSIKTIDVTPSKFVKLNSDSVKKISELIGVDKVGKVYTIAGKIKSNNSESSAVIYGSNQTYLDLSSLNNVYGSPISASDQMLATVNTSFLKAQGIEAKNMEKSINQKISITFEVPATTEKPIKVITKELTIKSIIESGSGSEVFIPSSIVENEGIINASQLKVMAIDRENAATVRKSIESKGFNTASPLDTVAEIDKVFQLLQIILVGFGGIGMIIAILGMFNTLTITLLERTREIGLIVILGGQQKDIKRLFMVEALMLSMIGGISGIFAAFLIGKIGDIALNMYAHSNGIKDQLTAFDISPSLVLTSLLATAVIGLLVVYFPARRASRISPLDAMRE